MFWHVRFGALLRLQNVLLHDWNRIEPELKEAVLRAVQTCLFDAAAGVYVAAVEVLCVIGRVDPSSAFYSDRSFCQATLPTVAPPTFAAVPLIKIIPEASRV